jgi:hypothetical protein
MDRENLGNGPIEASLEKIHYTRSSGNTTWTFSLAHGSYPAGVMGNFGLCCSGLDRSVFGGSIQSLVLTPIEDFFHG